MLSLLNSAIFCIEIQSLGIYNREVIKLKYTVTFSCGHSEVVSLFGKTSERERTLSYYERSGLCPACLEKKKAQDKERSEKQTQELLDNYGAADLAGSPKQRSWAEDIRLNVIKKFESNCNQYFSTVQQALSNGSCTAEKAEILKKDAQATKDKFISMVTWATEAKFWIENRQASIQNMLLEYDEIAKAAALDSSPKAEQAKQEITCKPVNQTHSGAVEIQVTDNRVRAFYQRDSDFGRIMYDLSYKWNSAARCYERGCSEFTGSSIDRASELANRLLQDGFAVMCFSSEVAEKAVSAQFEPECYRWVMYNNELERLIVKWGRKEDFYNAARSIPGSKWEADIRKISLPLSCWREIMDFANINGFMISDYAKQKIDDQKMSEIEVHPETPVKRVEEDRLGQILKSSHEVISDLVDR